MHFGLPHLVKCYQNITNSMPCAPKWLGTHTTALWTFLMMKLVLLSMKAMEKLMQLITIVL
jgi:hypothetical protein